MKYCPECENEFIDKVKLCPECDVSLITESQWEEISAGRDERAKLVFRPVKVAENQFEADVIRDILQQEGMPVLIRSYMDTAYNGIFLPQKGWGTVNVPEQDVEKAKEIIQLTMPLKQDTDD